MAEEKEVKILKIIDKIVDKNWKLRILGYDEAISEINSSVIQFDKKLEKYSSVLNKIVCDSNAVALEKGLDMILLYIEKVNINDIVAGEICPKIISCAGSIRPKTKEKGYLILKKLTETEKHDIVIKELFKSVQSKQPNILIGCVSVLKELLREFGPKIVPVKECSKILPQLFEDREKGVRDIGKELIVEMYRWFGKQVMTPQINSLKPVLLKEINVEFEKLPPVKPVPTSYLRSQKPKKAPLVANLKENTIHDDKDIADQYDLTEPVEVISKVPIDFFDKMDAKKWTDRRDALELIVKLTNHEKLVPGDFGELVKILIKVLSKDVNIIIVMLSSKILIQLSKGLRKKFSPYAIFSIQACLEKFKEKKPAVVKSLRECVDSIFETTTLESLTPTLIESLANKNPTVKSETVLFMNRIFLNSKKETITKKILKQLIPAVVKLSFDNNVDVREGSFQFLGTTMKVLSPSVIMPFLDQIDNVKKVRINDYFTKEVVEIVEDLQSQKVVPTSITVTEAEVAEVPEVYISFPSTKDKQKISLNSPINEKELLNQSFKEEEDDNNIAFKTQVLYFSLNEKETRNDSIISICKRRKSENVNLVVGEDEEIQDDCNVQSLPKIPKLCGDPDEYKNITKEMIINENEYLESYNHRGLCIERLERGSNHREVLSHDPIKKLINDILCPSVRVSYIAVSNFFNQSFLDDPDFLGNYGPFLIVVVLRQLSVIIRQLLSIDKMHYSVYQDSIHDLLYIISHVLSQDRDPLFTNEDIIEATVIVLGNIFHCTHLNKLSNCGVLIAIVTDIVCDIYSRCADLTIGATVSIVTTHLISNQPLPEYQYNDSYQSRLLDHLYDIYLQYPQQPLMELSDISKIDDVVERTNPEEVIRKINALRMKFDLDSIKL